MPFTTFHHLPPAHVWSPFSKTPTAAGQAEGAPRAGVEAVTGPAMRAAPAAAAAAAVACRRQGFELGWAPGLQGDLVLANRLHRTGQGHSMSHTDVPLGITQPGTLPRIAWLTLMALNPPAKCQKRSTRPTHDLVRIFGRTHTATHAATATHTHTHTHTHTRARARAHAQATYRSRRRPWPVAVPRTWRATG